MNPTAIKQRKSSAPAKGTGAACRHIPAVLVLALLLLWPAAKADAVRLKDLASVKGVRSNQLIGYGLVVGLDGTGDGNNATFTTQSLINMMENMGIHVDRDKIKVKNVASVMVTANLPAFVKVGQTIDVTVSSLGDASSLQGGTLIATPLKGLDKQVYAIGQGPVSIGGFAAAGAAAGTQKNHPTVARIPNGATVEREVPVSFTAKPAVTISLDSPDFTTVTRIVRAVDALLDGRYAQAVDGGTVEISIPDFYKQQEIALLAAIENIDIVPDAPARVVLDERTGTVVMGENVRISQLALSHGNLSLQITPRLQQGTEEIITGQSGDRLIGMGAGATLGEVVRALNSVGVAPRDLIAIFQSIKASGSLQADLEII